MVQTALNEHRGLHGLCGERRSYSAPRERRCCSSTLEHEPT